MICFALLVLAMVSLWDVNVFGVSYTPRHNLLAWTFTGAALYLFTTFLFARQAPVRMLLRALYVELGLFAGGLVTWLVYHQHHALRQQPMVSDWDGYVRVTPFHEQLALPAFVGLVLAPCVIGVAWLVERGKPRTLVS